MPDEVTAVLRKPVPVRAVQFVGGFTPAHDTVQWVLDNGGYAIYRLHGRSGWDNEPGSEHINISDKNAQCFASVGDWVICRGPNWFETCTDEEFQKTYRVRS